jgi:hypothetical protein
VWHVQTTESDHCCLVLECSQGRRGRQRRKGFRYENMWRHDPSYNTMVVTAWSCSGSPTSLDQLTENLGNLSSSLSTWAQTTFGSVRKELQRLCTELENVRRNSLHSGPSVREKQLMSRMSELLSREEIMMKQRSRIDWLKEGDRKTVFFHARARERSHANRISALISSYQPRGAGDRSSGVLLQAIYTPGDAGPGTNPRTRSLKGDTPK